MEIYVTNLLHVFFPPLSRFYTLSSSPLNPEGSAQYLCFPTFLKIMQPVSSLFPKKENIKYNQANIRCE